MKKLSLILIMSAFGVSGSNKAFILQLHPDVKVEIEKTLNHFSVVIAEVVENQKNVNKLGELRKNAIVSQALSTNANEVKLSEKARVLFFDELKKAQEKKESNEAIKNLMESVQKLILTFMITQALQGQNSVCAQQVTVR